MEKKKRPRLVLLDSLRGIMLISMIVYHAIWDMVYIYGVDFPWYMSTGAYVWQQSICWTFIILSGFCWSLGKRHLRRGLFVFVGGLLLTLVTIMFMPSSRVLFGILTLIGSCVLLMIPLDRLFRFILPEIGAALSALFFVLCRNIPDGWLGFEGWRITELPDFLYSGYASAYFGFPYDRFYSTDYFPLLPWIFLFIFGYFLHKILDKYHLCEKLFARGNIPVIGFIGRNTLPIYIVHQPIIYCVCKIVFAII